MLRRPLRRYGETIPHARVLVAVAVRTFCERSLCWIDFSQLCAFSRLLRRSHTEQTYLSSHINATGTDMAQEAPDWNELKKLLDRMEMRPSKSTVEESMLGRGGESYVVQASDGRVETGRQLAVKFYKADVNFNMQSVIRVCAQVQSVVQESDFAHLNEVTAVFDLKGDDQREESKQDEPKEYDFLLDEPELPAFRSITKDGVITCYELVGKPVGSVEAALVMPCLKSTLREVLKGKDKSSEEYQDIIQWPWKVKMHVLNGVLSIFEATGQGHGDIKPENVLFKHCNGTVMWVGLFLALHNTLAFCLLTLASILFVVSSDGLWPKLRNACLRS